jgi:inorganic pyrophosphatase
VLDDHSHSFGVPTILLRATAKHAASAIARFPRTAEGRIVIDKVSGYLKVDRPQKYSCPALYGFVPQTFCGESVAALSSVKTGRTLEGDSDPLDICVLIDRQIQHGNVLVESIPLGGFACWITVNPTIRL